jgi:ApaG protein
VTPPFYYRVTAGIRVTVRPLYLRQQSEPERGRFVFAYHIRLENVNDEAAQLLTRYWYIHDEAAEDSEVMGDGVVGEQPLLRPGDIHEYQSFCVLKGTSGWMEGHYGFQHANGTRFDVAIPRFELSVTPAL